MTEGSGRNRPLDNSSISEDEESTLAAAMKIAPRGAYALSGVALGLLIIIWLLIYIFVFLPRGPVG